MRENALETEIIYLDNAATTFPKPDVMHDTMHDFYKNYGVNPGRTGCDMALKAEEWIRDLRQKMTSLFYCNLDDACSKHDPNRLVFSANATQSLNMVLRGTLNEGDHVVTTLTEHNSVIRPVNHLVKMGREATYVEPDAEGYVDPEDIRRAIKKNTKLVIVNHASNVIGVVQDLKSIGKVCKEEGVQFAVDTAQTAGVLPIDMDECNIHFAAFTGHKGLFGPTGTGGLCVSDDAEIESSVWGGTGVRSAVPYHLEEYPYRLEAGTLNLAGIAGLTAGVDWILGKGLTKIYGHEIELLTLLQDGIKSIKGVRINGSENLEHGRRVAVLSFTIDNYDASDVGTFLDVEYNILSRTGLHCAPLIHEHIGTAPRGTVRLSCGPFNTREDIETTIKAVTEIAAIRN
ncbi:MAG: aminotransferase class V-fold PLP-dependent enzyme [Planctomycetota bacterium]|nr:MAG: aminotransferase class V-fold PLP-dependent enzyme [Planctomycetota bacterium]